MNHNLSHRLVARLAKSFPDSTHTSFLSLNTAEDSTIWQKAHEMGLIIVTLDKDFADLAILEGAPPKVIWLRCGNCSVSQVEQLLISNSERIAIFSSTADIDVLEIWP